MMARRDGGHPAAVSVRRGAGSDHRVHSVAGLLPPGAGLLMQRAVPRAPPHDLARRAGRRRIAAPGRGEPSPTTACCFSTRCSSSAGTCSKCCASRSRKDRVTIARAARAPSSRALHARWRDEPVPLRVLRRRRRSRECRCTPQQVCPLSRSLVRRCAIGSTLTVDASGVCRRITSGAADVGESSTSIRSRVVDARARPGRPLAATIAARERRAHAGPDANPLRARIAPVCACSTAVSRPALRECARMRMRVRKVARTIADLDGSTGDRGRSRRRGALRWRGCCREPVLPDARFSTFALCAATAAINPLRLTTITADRARSF